MHPELVDQARKDAGRTGKGVDGLDFGPMMAGIKPLISKADLAICHSEPVMGPARGPFEGFPDFQVPPQQAKTIKDIGYDTCSTASSHTLDHGYGGVKRTLDALDAAGLKHTGSARTAKEANTPLIMDVKGVGRRSPSLTASTSRTSSPRTANQPQGAERPHDRRPGRCLAPRRKRLLRRALPHCEAAVTRGGEGVRAARGWSEPMNGDWLVRGRDGRLSVYQLSGDAVLCRAEREPGGPWTTSRTVGGDQKLHPVLAIGQGADGYAHLAPARPALGERPRRLRRVPHRGGVGGRLVDRVGPATAGGRDGVPDHGRGRPGGGGNVVSVDRPTHADPPQVGAGTGPGGVAAGLSAP